MSDPLDTLQELLKVTPNDDLVEFYRRCPPGPGKQAVEKEIDQRGLPLPTTN